MTAPQKKAPLAIEVRVYASCPMPALGKFPQSPLPPVPGGGPTMTKGKFRMGGFRSFPLRIMFVPGGGNAMARISLDEQLAKAQRRLEQLRAQKEQRDQRQLAAVRDRQRKLETRRKVILGGQLLKLVNSGDADATSIYERMLSQLSER